MVFPHGCYKTDHAFSARQQQQTSGELAIKCNCDAPLTHARSAHVELAENLLKKRKNNYDDDDTNS